MKCEWKSILAKDFIEFNPKITLKKGTITKKVAMDKVLPYKKYINEFEYANYTGGSKFQDGDTIMARITPCLENGKTAFVDFLDENEVGFGSTEFIVLRERKGISDAQYIYYLSISPQFRKIAISSMVGSSGRQRVQQSVLDELELFVPDINEQRRIANILNKIDEKIRINNRINDNLENFIKNLFKDTFYNNKSNFSYKKISLGDLMDYQGGSQPPSSEFINYKRNGYIRFIQIRDYDSNSHITYIPISSKNKICNEKDIMIARYGAALGKICCGLNGAYNVALAKVIPRKSFYREFLRNYLSSKEFYIGINNKGERSAQSGFNKSDIKSFELLFPKDEKIVIKFEKIASNCFELYLKNLKQNRTLENIRNKLLPYLISGKIDISDIELRH